VNSNDQDSRIESLQRENERLRQELRRMHQGARLGGRSLAPSLGGAALSGSGTFLGLEELILQVNGAVLGG
jgi:hypothetical protein